jgi:hypothetical protein
MPIETAIGRGHMCFPNFFQRYRAQQYPHLFPVPSNEEEAEYEARAYEQAAHDVSTVRLLRLFIP